MAAVCSWHESGVLVLRQERRWALFHLCPCVTDGGDYGHGGYLKACPSDHYAVLSVGSLHRRVLELFAGDGEILAKDGVGEACVCLNPFLLQNCCRWALGELLRQALKRKRGAI